LPRIQYNSKVETNNKWFEIPHSGTTKEENEINITGVNCCNTKKTIHDADASQDDSHPGTICSLLPKNRDTSLPTTALKHIDSLSSTQQCDSEQLTNQIELIGSTDRSFNDLASTSPEGIRFGQVTCSICVEEFLNNEILIMLPVCQHLYHIKCIKEWLLEQQSEFCPICKTKVKNRLASTSHHLYSNIESLSVNTTSRTSSTRNDSTTNSQEAAATHLPEYQN
jgi:Ring finger domain